MQKDLALSFDIEDWFCVKNMQNTIPFDSWTKCEQRVRIGVEYILSELSKRRFHATFFVLGWIAERFPSLIRDIDREGHEIASHGYSHTPLTQLTPETFEEDLRRSLDVLRTLSSKPVIGFRAPSFSVTKQTLWAIDILKRHGILYDSSIFPVYHPDYGIPEFGHQIQELNGVVEFPLTSLRAGRFLVPISGGGYFRLFPYSVTRMLLKVAQKRQPVLLYFHPWEFDPEQPRIALPALKRFRHYSGLSKNRVKFERLLSDFSFCPIWQGNGMGDLGCLPNENLASRASLASSASQ